MIVELRTPAPSGRTAAGGVAIASSSRRPASCECTGDDPLRPHLGSAEAVRRVHQLCSANTAAAIW